MEQLEETFTEKCWELKQQYDEVFQEAFKGYRGSKKGFKEQLIMESTNYSAASVPLDDLKTKAETIFAASPKPKEILAIPDWKNLLTHETNPILEKKVIGKSDVDIAAMIQQLSNSDWIKQGRKFYDPETCLATPTLHTQSSTHLSQQQPKPKQALKKDKSTGYMPNLTTHSHVTSSRPDGNLY